MPPKSISTDTTSPDPGPRRGRRRLLVPLTVLVAALGVGAILWFQPHKAFIDERVNERIEGLDDIPAPGAVPPTPTSTAAGGAAESSTTTAAETPTGPTLLARGAFESLAHETSGEVLLVQLPSGRHALQFTDFRTDNGPDLKVFVSALASPSEGGADDADYAAGALNLGRLKGNQGDQFYELPEGFDPAGFRSVSVWCERFAVGFGVAPLMPV